MARTGETLSDIHIHRELVQSHRRPNSPPVLNCGIPAAVTHHIHRLSLIRNATLVCSWSAVLPPIWRAMRNALFTATPRPQSMAVDRYQRRRACSLHHMHCLYLIMNSAVQLPCRPFSGHYFTRGDSTGFFVYGRYLRRDAHARLLTSTSVFILRPSRLGSQLHRRHTPDRGISSKTHHTPDRTIFSKCLQNKRAPEDISGPSCRRGVVEVEYGRIPLCT